MTTPRPKSLTPEAALRVGQAIAADLVNGGEIQAREADACARDLARLGRKYIDGYELARDLERYCNWSPTAEMVEVLSNFGHLAAEEIEKAEKAWALEHNIQPPLPVGTPVAFHRGTGVIDEIYQYGAAKYSIKEDGDPDANGPSKRRIIINFEDVRAIARAAGQES